MKRAIVWSNPKRYLRCGEGCGFLLPLRYVRPHSSPIAEKQDGKGGNSFYMTIVKYGERFDEGKPVSRPISPALARMRAYLDSGDTRAALKLAASWRELGDERDAIQKGWAATQNPDFYRTIEQNPDDLVAAGLAALYRRYAP